VRFFASRYEFSLWIVCCVYGVHIFAFNWWDDFFDTLQARNESYRMLQIWVQADSPKAPAIVPIGASKTAFTLWRKDIDRWLYQSLRHPEIAVYYSLILDRPTWTHHAALLEQWKRRYPSQIEILFYQDVFATAPQLPCGSTQCSHGIAAACSDILRLLALHNPSYDYNVYMDVDTFIHRYQSALNPYWPSAPFASTSAHLFGLHLTQPGLAQSFLSVVGSSFDRSALQINNDFLIDYKMPDWLWSCVQTLGFERISQAAPLFDLCADRSSIRSFADYSVHLDRKVQYALHNPERNINPIPLVIYSAGPGLWKDLYVRGLSQPYRLPQIPSSGEWMNHSAKVYGLTSVNDLTLFVDGADTIHTMIALNFLSHDYYYYHARHTPWLAELKHALLQHYHALSPEDVAIGKHLFHSSFEWLEEIQNA